MDLFPAEREHTVLVLPGGNDQARGINAQSLSLILSASPPSLRSPRREKERDYTLLSHNPHLRSVSPGARNLLQRLLGNALVIHTGIAGGFGY
jgi:hypothetical protein